MMSSQPSGLNNSKELGLIIEKNNELSIKNNELQKMVDDLSNEKEGAMIKVKDYKKDVMRLE